ncbi:hypothetical protein [Atopococcus tabaci]|uniref:hypothetical protein n=1 Tax=Atopococcus tabaci TaxID=269774 RepID=UPI0012EBAA1B|nr:hypothetical protein [Atopococcus tabaci]
MIRTTRRLLLLAMLLPVWGAAMAYIAESYARKKKIGSRTDELPVLNDNRFSFLLQPVFLEEGTRESVVPLEEALLLEEPAVRRELMLDIIQEDPKRYISMLKKVRLGDDAEVSHYASTALMQIQREYEMDLRKKEDALHARPGDEEAVSAYLDKLKEYIQSGLLANNAVLAQRRKLNTMLVQLLAESDGDKQLYADAVENLCPQRVHRC